MRKIVIEVPEKCKELYSSGKDSCYCLGYIDQHKPYCWAFNTKLEDNRWGEIKPCQSCIDTTVKEEK